MTRADVFQDFVYCTLTADATAVTGTDELFVDELGRIPTPADVSLGPDFYMTIESPYATGDFEIVKPYSKSADSGPGSLYVYRAQEGTAALAHPSGMMLKGALTAGHISRIMERIDAAHFYADFVGDWSPGTSWSYRNIVKFNGGLYLAGQDIPNVPGLGDPTTITLYSDGEFSLLNDGTGSNTQPIDYSLTIDKAAQGFQADPNSINVAGVDFFFFNIPTSTSVTVGIADSLGAGTPSYLVSGTLSLSDIYYDTLGRTRGRAIFSSPIILDADTQYYFVMEGAADWVSNWEGGRGDVMTVSGGAGVLTDATYDAVYDSTFSTPFAYSGQPYYLLAQVLNNQINPWVEIVPPSGGLTADSNLYLSETISAAAASGTANTVFASGYTYLDTTFNGWDLYPDYTGSLTFHTVGKEITQTSIRVTVSPLVAGDEVYLTSPWGTNAYAKCAPADTQVEIEMLQDSIFTEAGSTAYGTGSCTVVYAGAAPEIDSELLVRVLSGDYSATTFPHATEPSALSFDSVTDELTITYDDTDTTITGFLIQSLNETKGSSPFFQWVASTASSPQVVVVDGLSAGTWDFTAWSTNQYGHDASGGTSLSGQVI